jgi:hypothetical protein
MKIQPGKISKMILYSLLILILFVGVLIIIDRYFFSLTGFVSGQTRLCKHKTVRVPGENANPQKLSFSIDPKHIASELKKMPAYEVNDWYEGNRAVISRRFGDVKYNIVLEFRYGDGQGQFNLNTFDFKGYPEGSVDGGETCTTPNRVLMGNVHQMIDDMPLSDGQKDEMKQHVRVTMVGDFLRFF